MRAVLELVRHAMTPGNLERRYVGRTDEGLSPRGIALAEANARPAGEIPARVWVSPMARCQETARLLYPGAELVPIPGLRETDFGEFEYRTYEELKNNPAYRAWVESEGRGGIPGGEDRAAFEDRCAQAFRQVIRELLQGYTDPVPGAAHQSPCGAEREVRGAVVTHGGVLMALCARFAVPRRDFYQWQSPCCGGWLAEAGDGFLRGNEELRILGPIVPLTEEEQG